MIRTLFDIVQVAPFVFFGSIDILRKASQMHTLYSIERISRLILNRVDDVTFQ